jgi:hypothetical protein
MLIRSSSQRTYTEVLETRIINWDIFEFESFSHSDFDQIEHQTLKNVEKSHAIGTSSKITLAGLAQRDKASTKKSYAGSVSSVSCETGSVVGGGSEREQNITTPSLTINKTLPEKSETSLDEKIRRTETRLENLKKLKSSERHLTDKVDTHEDWAGFVEPQGPPIDVENQLRVSKMLSRMKEVVSTAITSATDLSLEKRRRYQNTSPPPLGLHSPSDLSAPQSPATKRVRTGEPSLDPDTFSEMNNDKADFFDQTTLSSGWDNVFNWEFYEAAN